MQPNMKQSVLHLFVISIMNKILLAALSLTVLSPITSYANDNDLHYNVINIQAEAEREVSNDLMHAVLYVEKSHKQPAQLANDINQLLNQATHAAKKYPQVKIETGAQSTYPIYDTDNRKLKEWRGRSEIRLESADFKASSQLISELQQYLQTSSIHFSVSDQKRKQVENELMMEASQNFQQRAKTMAKAWNKASYQLVSLNINTNNYAYAAAMPRVAMMKASADSVTEQNVAAGDSKMSVSASGAIQLQ